MENPYDQYDPRQDVNGSPGYQIQYAWKAMDSEGSDSDSGDSTIYPSSELSNIDVNRVLGQSIVVWTYARPDSLSLFTPRPDDTLYHVIKYAQSTMGFNRQDEKLVFMDPGEKVPREIKDFYMLKPGSVAMVMPKGSINITMEINQLKTKLQIKAEPMCTVYEIKAYLKRVKGIPIEQQDILYRDKALENSKRLYENKIKDGATMYLLIQVCFDLIVNVETFWGMTYRLYIDRCSTGSDLIYTIFGRTFSKSGPHSASVHELYVPAHVLVLHHKDRSIQWDYCLGYFDLKNGDTLVLNTVGKQSNINMQSMKVISETGDKYEVTVSHFDRWSVVAFILHGLTQVPVDLIRLFREKQEIDFTRIIGRIPKRSVLLMNILTTKMDNDMMFGIPLKVNLGHGITEIVKMTPSVKVKEVKTRLENMGVPNASMYELSIRDYKLPNTAKLQDTIYDLQIPLALTLERFPMFLHAPDGIIYKTIVDVNHTINHLKHKVELKSGIASSSCRLLLTGEELKLSDDANLYENGFCTKTSLFVETSSFMETFFITRGHLLIKLRIPIVPHADEIKRSIWDCKDIPEGSISCLQTFLFWFFRPRVSKHYMLSRKIKQKRRLPAAHAPLVQLSDRKPLRQARDDGHLFDTGSYVGEKDPDKGREKLVYGGIKLNYHEPEILHQDPTLWPPAAAKESKTWPHIPNSNPDVEAWIKATQPDPKYDRSHPTRAKRGKKPRKERKNQERTSKKPTGVHHFEPRWMNNLYEKTTSNRLVNTDNVGLAYRPKNSYPHSAFEMAQPRRKQVSNPRHHYYPRYNRDQVYNTKFAARRYMDNRPEYLNSSSDDSSDSDDELQSEESKMLPIL